MLGWLRRDISILYELLMDVRRRQMSMQDEIGKLRSKIEESKTVMTGATAMITALAKQIRDAADDPDELRALADSLEAGKTELAAAVEANTVAETGGEPTPTPSEPPTPTEPTPAAPSEARRR